MSNKNWGAILSSGNGCCTIKEMFFFWNQVVQPPNAGAAVGPQNILGDLQDLWAGALSGGPARAVSGPSLLLTFSAPISTHKTHGFSM
jgi:hypothetical protein